MNCDIQVPEARFTMHLMATREVLFNNDIYQANRTLVVDQQFHLTYHSLVVVSRDNAEELLQSQSLIDIACQSVTNAMTKYWNARGFNLTYAEPVDMDVWDIVLLAAKQERPTMTVHVRLGDA